MGPRARPLLGGVVAGALDHPLGTDQHELRASGWIGASPKTFEAPGQPLRVPAKARFARHDAPPGGLLSRSPWVASRRPPGLPR